MPALSRIHRQFTFRLIGARGADQLVAEMRRLPGLDLEIVDRLEPARMATAASDPDIAVPPLEQNAWNAKLGEAGRRSARQRYCLDTTGPELARIVGRAAGWRQPRG